MAEIKALIKKVGEDSNKLVASLTECIEKLKNEEKFEADSEDAATLMKMLKGMTNEDESAVYVLQLIADIVKLESNRKLFNDSTLMCKLVELLMCNSPDTCIQAIRSLANICAENEDACGLFLEYEGVEKIIKKS